MNWFSLDKATSDEPCDAASAVANGAQALDEKRPGWWRKINLDRLDIGHIYYCVCGQLDALENHRDAFGLPEVSWTRMAEEVTGSDSYADYGFRPSRRFGIHELNKEWRLVIEARLEADNRLAQKKKEAVTA